MASRFPLRLHKTGQYVKRHRGKSYYFGSDRKLALKRFLVEWRAITEGHQRQRIRPGAATVLYAVNHFLDRRRQDLAAGTLSPSQWNSYLRDSKRVLDTLGRDSFVAELGPADFAELADTIAGQKPESRKGIVGRIRAIFRHAKDYKLITEAVDFGPDFRKPSELQLRLARTKKDLTAAQVRKAIKAAPQPLKAMILLGINCGFTQADCSDLDRPALAERGWHALPRSKTGMPRRCPLWPETIAALKAAAKMRPEPLHEDDDGQVFITRWGRRYVRVVAGAGQKAGARIDGILSEYRKLATRLGVPSGFYRLRHTFLTVADDVVDTNAVDRIMGHVDLRQSAKYRHRINDDRLRAVTNAVRKWLFGK